MTTSDLFLFVSHVKEDRPAALQVVGELERRGVRCWIAPRDVRPGKPFDDEIASAIEDCRAMLLIFSERCNESDYIRREVTVAGEANKVVIAFRIEDAQPKKGLRVRLADLHWIDGFVAREQAIDDLVRAIQPPQAMEVSPQASPKISNLSAPVGARATDRSGIAHQGNWRKWPPSLRAMLIGGSALGVAGLATLVVIMNHDVGTTRLPNLAGGGWQCRTYEASSQCCPDNKATATIFQVGTNLTLNNGCGGISPAHFENDNMIIVADEWENVRGTISSNSNIITWNNGTEWFR